MREAQAYANPSLALAKYWGKDPHRTLIPAVSSVAITLDGLQSRCSLQVWQKGEAGYGQDTVILNNIQQDSSRYSFFFSAARKYFPEQCTFSMQASNNFPTAAGLASSSSGFAAAARAVALCSPKVLSDIELSSLARCGSVSAARSVFGGFVRLPSQAEYAEQIYPADHWPELRVIVACVTRNAKAISSRIAMERCQNTSPFFPAWVQDAEKIARDIEQAIAERNLKALGMSMRTSYLRMFSTMFSANPPLIYWTEDSMSLINTAERLRKQGCPVWESMDAGPQVKFLTTREHSEYVYNTLHELTPDLIVCTVGTNDAES